MPIRMNVAILLLLLVLSAPVMGAEKVYHIRAGATVDHAAGVYPDLETLRTYIADGTVFLDAGSVIMLYNDDRSMAQGIAIRPGTELRVTSANGGNYKIWNKNGMTSLGPFYAMTGDVAVHFDNVVIDMVPTKNGTSSSIFTGESGTLRVSNSILTTDLNDNIRFTNTAAITVSNSIFGGTGAYAVNARGAGSTLNIVFDANARNVSTWSKDSYVNGTMHVDVAKGKKFEQKGWITAQAVTKSGAGVWKIAGGTASSLRIDEGTVHFGNDKRIPVFEYDENGVIKVDENGYPVLLRVVTWEGDTVHLGKNAVLKVTWDPGNVRDYFLAGAPDSMKRTDDITHFEVDRLISEKGARTEIGNISRHPTTPITQSGTEGDSARTWTYGQWVVFVGSGNTENTIIAPSMNIDNQLLKATWKSGYSGNPDLSTTVNEDPDVKDVWLIHIEELNNLATLKGIGSFADVYRMMDLTDDERDMLDTIYCAGGATGSQRGFLQTLGGYHVQNTLLALRHNQADMLQKVNRRVTGYQKEDIYDLAVKGGENCNFSEWDACTDGGEMWAYLEQTWMSQNDIDSLAGYRYQNHTLGLGYDWHTGSWIYGGVLNYSAGKLKLRNNYGASTDIDHLMGSLYASYARDGMYLTGTVMAGYGWNDSTSRFILPTIDVTTRTGNYASSNLGAALEAGYMWETEFAGAPLRVTPYGGLGYSRLHRSGVKESGGEFAGGSMNRDFRAADWHVWEVTAGARVAMPLERDGYILIPNADISFTRTLGTHENTGGDARFIDRGMTGWKIPLMASNRSSLRMSANLDARIRQNLTIGAGYEFEWRDRYWKQQLNLGMSLGF